MVFILKGDMFERLFSYDHCKSPSLKFDILQNSFRQKKSCDESSFWYHSSYLNLIGNKYFFYLKLTIGEGIKTRFHLHCTYILGVGVETFFGAAELFFCCCLDFTCLTACLFLYYIVSFFLCGEFQ